MFPVFKSSGVNYKGRSMKQNSMYNRYARYGLLVIALLIHSHGNLNAAAGNNAGQSLWCITNQLAITTDTILEKVTTILDVVENIVTSTSSFSSACFSLPLTNANAAFGTITLSIFGNYCLASNLTADILITSSCVMLDLNSRCLQGTIVVNAPNALITNGSVQPPAAPDSTTAQNFPGIAINSNGNYTTLKNVFVQCTASSADGVDGRRGIISLAPNTQITDCQISSGDGAPSAVTNAGNGGTALLAQEGNLFIQGCTITSGKGGNYTARSKAFFGGSSGIAINVGNDVQQPITPGNGALSRVFITNNTIFVPDAGFGFVTSGTLSTNGDVLSGIIVQADDVSEIVIANNNIQLGNGKNVGKSYTVNTQTVGAGVLINSLIANINNVNLQENSLILGNGDYAICSGIALSTFYDLGIYSNASINNVAINNCDVQLGNGGQLVGFTSGDLTMTSSLFGAAVCFLTTDTIRNITVTQDNVVLGNGNTICSGIAFNNYVSYSFTDTTQLVELLATNITDVTISDCNISLGFGNTIGINQLNAIGGLLGLIAGSGGGISFESLTYNLTNIAIENTNIKMGDIFNFGLFVIDESAAVLPFVQTTLGNGIGLSALTNTSVSIKGCSITLGSGNIPFLPSAGINYSGKIIAGEGSVGTVQNVTIENSAITTGFSTLILTGTNSVPGQAIPCIIFGGLGGKPQGPVISNCTLLAAAAGFFGQNAPAINYNGGGGGIIENCVINSGASVENIDSFSTIILNGATDVTIQNCIITAGSTEGETSKGGSGIELQNQCERIQIQNCTIPLTGAGVNIGGNGILISSQSQYVGVRNCTISNTGASPIVGGNGILCNSQSANIEIENCFISNLGNGIAGQGGNGVLIQQNCVNMAVRNCTIGNTGMGPHPANNGMAIQDNSAPNSSVNGGSVIFGNFAYDIANPSMRYLIQSGTVSPSNMFPNGQSVFAAGVN